MQRFRKEQSTRGVLPWEWELYTESTWQLSECPSWALTVWRHRRSFLACSSAAFTACDGRWGGRNTVRDFRSGVMNDLFGRSALCSRSLPAAKRRCFD